MTKILLIRHGHVEGIRPPRFRGRADLPLIAASPRPTPLRGASPLTGAQPRSTPVRWRDALTPDVRSPTRAVSKPKSSMT
jgi:hypothetical protein